MTENYRSLSAEEAQQIGQRLYRTKKYREALAAFTAAIYRSDRASIGALDNRAATYTKLGDLQAALRDAKRMIDLERSAATGYLRTGQVLQLLDKADLALGVYKYGLRNVPPDGPNYKLLEGMFNKMTRTQAPPKAVDFLFMLPVELVEMIIKYLPFNTLVILLGVSKQWNQLLTSMPRLWIHLDLSRAKKPVTMTAFRACVERSKGGITHATLNCATTKWDAMLKHIFKRSRDLHHLEINQGFTSGSLLEAANFTQNLSTLIVSKSCMITLDAVTRILNVCDMLERAEFHWIHISGVTPQWQISSKLRTLTLSTGDLCPGVDTVWNLHSLLDQIPDISELCLPAGVIETAFTELGFSRLLNLRLLKLCRTRLPLLPRLPSTIHHLHLVATSIHFAWLESRQSFEDYCLHELKTLDLSHNQLLTYPALQILLNPSKGKVTELDLSCCGQIDKAAIDGLITNGYLDGIMNLRWSHSEVDDSIAEALAASCPQLKRLDLSYTKITGVGVKSLVQKPQGMIEELCLNNCAGVSIDAVTYAKAKGISVSFRFPDSVKYGKRIRLS